MRSATPGGVSAAQFRARPDVPTLHQGKANMAFADGPTKALCPGGSNRVAANGEPTDGSHSSRTLRVR